MSVFQGIFFHGIGASSASLCYTPQKKIKQWSWQSYWLMQAFFCWFLLPIIGAMITIPELGTVLKEAPSDAMWKSFILGALYGIGGTAFGLAIRHIGYSLTYAISIGISCVLGTLLPPLVRGELASVFNQNGAEFIMLGMLLGLVGIGVCGLAGRSKENDLSNDNASEFSLGKGLFLAISAGVLSALFGFSLDQGQPIADVAAAHGAGQFQGNVIYLFSNTGAFIFPLIYCIYLHKKQGTFSEYFGQSKGAESTPLTRNYLLSALTGLLWYTQFFFYGLGHIRMGEYKFSSWAIHMIMLVLLSSFSGIMMKEWNGTSLKTKWSLASAIMVLIGAVVALTYGNSIA